MQEDLQKLVDVDDKLCNAIRQLTEQHSLIATTDCERSNPAAVCSLLAHALHQFRWLERQRRAIVDKLNADNSS